MNKKQSLFVFGFLLLACSLLRAQLGNTTTLLFPGVPTGACSSLQLGLNMANGNLYSCNNGAWAVAGGGLPTASVVASFPLAGSGGSLTALYLMPPSEVSTTTLSDYSGNSNNGTFPGGGANPTRLANGGLGFANASSQYISLPSALNGTKTFLLVTYFDPNASGVTDRMNVLSPNTGNANGGPTMFLSPSLAGYASPNHLQGAGVWGIRAFDASSTLQGGDQIPAHGYSILIWAENNPDNVYHYNVTTQNGGNLSTLPSGNYYLGGSGIAGGHFFQGQILLAGFWSVALTQAQVAQAVQAAQQQIWQADGIYLSGRGGDGKWQSPSSVGDNSTLSFHGDSEASYILNPNLPTIPATQNINVFGQAGLTCGEINAQANYMIDTILPNVGTGQPFVGIPTDANGFGGTKAAIIFNCGTNDPGGGTNLGAWAKFARDRRNAGWSRIASASIISDWSGGNHDARKNTNNPLYRQYWPFYYDVFINLAAAPALGANGALQNTTYSTSLIHPDTTISEQMVGRMYSWAYRRMFGNTLQGGSFNISAATPYLIQPEDIFYEDNQAGANTAYLYSAQFFTGQTITVKNIGAGTLTVNPHPVSCPVTNLALTANLATITCANNWTAGDVVVITGQTTTPNLDATPTSCIVNSTGLSAASFQCAITHANIGSGAETGVATDTNYSQVAAITNIAETAGNVVTATISNNFANGNSVKISGVGTATWLNGQTVSLTTANSTTITFTDGSSHGVYASAADTGTVIFTYAADTINAGGSATVSTGATAVFLSVFGTDAAGGANWITIQNN